MAANPSIQLGTDGNWAIKEDNLLAYKKDGTRFFNKEFDFTRGSFATFVDKDGLIKVSGLQETNLVNNGDFSEIGPELVTNGDFATDSDWTKGTGWSISGGKANCDGTQTSQTTLESTNLALGVGNLFKITFDISNYSSGQIDLITLVGTGGPEITNINADGSYTAYSFGPSGSDNRIQIIANSDFIGSIDNVSVKEVGQNWTLGTGWSIDQANSKAVFNGGADAAIQQLNVVENGKTYKFKIDVNDRTSGNLQIRFGNTGVFDAQINSNGSYVNNFTSDGTTLYLRAISGFNGSITNVSIQEIQTDVPRIDFTNNATGHLLLEPQSTNLFPYSEDFSEWSALNGAVVTDNFTTSPDGTKNASKFTFDGHPICRVEKETAVTNGNTYTFSVWLKNDNLSDPTQVWLGLSTYGQGEYITVTNQWQRFTTTQIANGSNEYPRVQSSATGSIFAWGAQFEEKSYATSYIPTNNSTATRLADICNNSGSAQDFNSEEGVLYAEISALADDETNREITLSDGTTDNYVLIRFNSGGSNRIYTRVDVNTSIQYFELNTSYNITNYNKIAIRYKNSDFSTFINGTEVDFQLSGNSFPSNTLNKLNFDNGGGHNKFHGNVKSVAVFKRAMSNGELYLLTVTQYQSYQEMATALNYTL